MKTIYIHIGPPKTGSTSIQNFLYQNNNSLRKVHAVYDHSGYELARQLSIGNAITPTSLENTRRHYNQVYSGIKEEKIILSGESFFGNILVGYTNIDRIAKNTKYIFQDFNVKIISFTRRHDIFLESNYIQQIKTGSSYEFENFLNNIKKYQINWPFLLDQYEAVFGHDNMIIVPYEEYKKDNNGIFSYIFKKMGIELNLKSSPSVLNKGYSQKALEISKRCNPILTS